MIKIEQINAHKATIVRNGVKQPLALHSTISQAELESIEALSGTIVYSVDEKEVKELKFEAPKVELALTRPVIKQPASKIVKPIETTPENPIE